MDFYPLDPTRMPFDVPRLGVVNYVTYRALAGIIQLFPNNATVNGKALAAVAETPQAAWERVVSSARLVKEFAICL